MKHQDRILDSKSQESSNSIETSFLNHEFFQISNDSITSKEDSIKGSLPQKSRQRESQETRCSEFETAFGKNYICGLKSSTIIESINSFEEILYSKINAFQKNKSASDYKVQRAKTVAYMIKRFGIKANHFWRDATNEFSKQK